MEINGYILSHFYAGIVTYVATNKETGEIIHAWSISDLARAIGATIEEVKEVF